MKCCWSGLNNDGPREVLEALPRIDAERVREITWTFRKRTSSADDHVVIEMLRELEMEMWWKIAQCFRLGLLNHWTEDSDEIWKHR